MTDKQEVKTKEEGGNTFNYNALKLLLDEKNIKPAHLADLTGIPRNTVGRYLKGETAPGTERMEAIADALEVPLTFLGMMSHAEAAELGDLLTAREAAKLMGVSVARLKAGIINNEWNPSIGSAISAGPRYAFHIPKKRVELYLGIGVQALSTNLVEYALKLRELMPKGGDDQCQG